MVRPEVAFSGVRVCWRWNEGVRISVWRGPVRVGVSVWRGPVRVGGVQRSEWISLLVVWVAGVVPVLCWVVRTWIGSWSPRDQG